jgi:hypothetical protein
LIGGLLGTIGGLLGGGSSSGSNGDVVITIPQYTLTRQVADSSGNLGPPAVFARDVRQFGLSYLYRSMSPPPTPASIERTNPLVSTNDPLLGSFNQTVINTGSGSAAWIGATFQPSTFLPSGSTSITITRVQFYLRTDVGVDGVLYATVRTASGNQPPAGVNGGLIAGATSRQVPEVSLPSLTITTGSTDPVGWVDFVFPTPVTLSVASTTKYCVILQALSGASGNSAGISYVTPLLGGSSTPLVTWNGATWGNSTSSFPRFRIYGTYN